MGGPGPRASGTDLPSHASGGGSQTNRWIGRAWTSVAASVMVHSSIHDGARMSHVQQCSALAVDVTKP